MVAFLCDRWRFTYSFFVFSRSFFFINHFFVIHYIDTKIKITLDGDISVEFDVFRFSQFLFSCSFDFILRVRQRQRSVELIFFYFGFRGLTFSIAKK